MNDFKNKYTVDFLCLGMLVILGFLLSKDYTKTTSIIGALSLLLTGTFVATTANLQAKLTSQEEIISKNKQKLYIFVSILILIGISTMGFKILLLAISMPVAFSITGIINSILFKG